MKDETFLKITVKEPLAFVLLDMRSVEHSTIYDILQKAVIEYAANHHPDALDYLEKTFEDD